MLMRAGDVRLPTRLTHDELTFIATAIFDAAAAVKG
jgi:perosamine synthetase